MTGTFSLRRFPSEEAGPDVRIEGTIGRSGETLSVACSILGDLSTLAIPLPATSPRRRNRLWEETCLELFLAETGAERYWEFHLSPTGDWNVFRFSSYREGMREEPALSSLPFRAESEPGALRLGLDFRLNLLLPAGVAVEAAVCAVLRTAAGNASHWALAHPGPRPDFHRRDGFRLYFPRKR